MTTTVSGMALRRLYLSVYNWVVFFGWVQVLYGATSALLRSGAFYAAVERPLQFAQTAALVEIIKYSFFGTKETFGFAPSWLVWLRYSTFLMLIPIGMLSEYGLIFVAMPSMKTSGKYCVMMPNRWNFSFDYRYTSAVLAAICVPGFPYLFRYMLAKRKKILCVSCDKNCMIPQVLL